MKKKSGCRHAPFPKKASGTFSKVRTVAPADNMDRFAGSFFFLITNVDSGTSS